MNVRSAVPQIPPTGASDNFVEIIKYVDVPAHVCSRWSKIYVPAHTILWKDVEILSERTDLDLPNYFPLDPLFLLLILVEWGVLLVNETKEQKNCNSICLQSFKRVKCRTRLSFNKFSFVPFVKLWREGARLGKWTWLQENKSSSSKCWKFKYRPTDHLNKQYTFLCCFAVFHCCLKPYFWKEK